jgi:hypothetical protein
MPFNIANLIQVGDSPIKQKCTLCKVEVQSYFISKQHDMLTSTS